MLWILIANLEVGLLELRVNFGCSPCDEFVAWFCKLSKLTRD